MTTFEDFGKRIDEELKRLRVFVDKDLKPTTATALRTAAKHLAQIADEIDARLSDKK